MFLINGNPLSVDTAFTDADGNQYPANWLRLSTSEEKAAIGITEVADPVRADDRFYWNGDINTPKALEDETQTDQEGNTSTVKGLKSQFIAQIKQTANTLLQPSDWMVLRQLSRGIGMSHIYEDYRTAVIAKSNELETAIAAVTTVEELIALDLSFPKQD